MFNFFKKKSEIDILKERYASTMKDAYELSKVNRSRSDAKYAEAEAIMIKIESLKGK